MLILYDLIFLLITLVYFPAYLFRRKFHRGFWQRLGFLPKDLNLERPIWVHAVSVGEAIAIKGLIEELRTSYPNKKFVISTVTATGNKIAQGIAKGSDFVTYLPLDFSFIVRRVIDKVKPEFFIIAETEIWPNLISCLYKKNIPVIIVNGRISDRSFAGYRMIKLLLKGVLNKISLFCLQSQRDKERLLKLGANSGKIEVTGNMKFDFKYDSRDYKKSCLPAGRDYTDLRQKLDIGFKEKLFTAASTHPGEEEIILSVYRKLLAVFPDLRLLVAPRHPERANDIEKVIIKYDFQPLKISRLHLQPIAYDLRPTLRLRSGQATYDLKPVFILDMIGQLMSYYAISDIVFVGGSLIKKGGHNILEPASLAKPILFGPRMFNFRDIAGLFLENNACILVHDEEEMKRAIADLLGNPGKMVILGEKARGLIAQNQGATMATVQLIKKYDKKN